MTVEPKVALRLQFLVRVVRKECQHLVDTDKRLFESAFTLEQANQLEKNIELLTLRSAPKLESACGRVRTTHHGAHGTPTVTPVGLRLSNQSMEIR